MVSGFPRTELVVAACQHLDRRKAAEILWENLKDGPSGDARWRDVAQMSMQIGEISLAIEALRRLTASASIDLDTIMFAGLMLMSLGRYNDALELVHRVAESERSHPALLHFQTVIATHQGKLEEAETFARQAIAVSPAPVQWLSLSLAKTFSPGDPDIVAMEALLPRVMRAPPNIRAQLFYSLGKAYDDVRDYERALQAYTEGAALMRTISNPPNSANWNRFVDHLIDGFTKENVSTLTPSQADEDRVLFVTGFPRSGTTLVEHILASHSQICDGAELNLIPTALMPAGHINHEIGALKSSSEADDYLNMGDFLFSDASAYQMRTKSSDPWGDLGRDYLKMVSERFGPKGKVIDKTLNLGSFMGLLLHSLPKAKVFWLRRRPEDCALSVFRLCTHVGTLPWSYSFSDIAAFFKAEDRLFEHWTAMFPDRILPVQYETLVSDKENEIRRIFAFANMDVEPQVFEPHKSTRAVSTASMTQVRKPISAARIGAAEAYGPFMEEFRRAYYGRV